MIREEPMKVHILQPACLCSAARGSNSSKQCFHKSEFVAGRTADFVAVKYIRISKFISTFSREIFWAFPVVTGLAKYPGMLVWSMLALQRECYSRERDEFRSKWKPIASKLFGFVKTFYRNEQSNWLFKPAILYNRGCQTTPFSVTQSTVSSISGGCLFVSTIQLTTASSSQAVTWVTYKGSIAQKPLRKF